MKIVLIVMLIRDTDQLYTFINSFLQPSKETHFFFFHPYADILYIFFMGEIEIF